MDDIVSRYYLRFSTVDKPGVVARIASILGQYQIGISSMMQPEEHTVDTVPIVIMTHDAKEADIRRALGEIDQLDVVHEPSHFIRIETSIE
ncbi:MAG: ACT domain-containing protein [Syntrophotaleaceae bacterium]